MSVESYKQDAKERRRVKQVEIINVLSEFLSGDDSGKALSMRVIASMVGLKAPTLYHYFRGGVGEIATALFVDALKDYYDPKTGFFDFYMANINEARFVFDLKNGVNLKEIEWFDNSCKEKLGYIVAKILESDNDK
jgi:AcrR family transcriptional regulator